MALWAPCVEIQLLSASDLHRTHLRVLWNCSPRPTGCLCASGKVSEPGVSDELRSLLMRLSNWHIVLEKRTWPTACSLQIFPHDCQLLPFLESLLWGKHNLGHGLDYVDPSGILLLNHLNVFKKEIYSSRKLCFGSRHFRGPRLNQFIFLLTLAKASSCSLGRASCVRDSSKLVKSSSCPRELPRMLCERLLSCCLGSALRW